MAVRVRGCVAGHRRRGAQLLVPLVGVGTDRGGGAGGGADVEQRACGRVLGGRRRWRAGVGGGPQMAEEVREGDHGRAPRRPQRRWWCAAGADEMVVVLGRGGDGRADEMVVRPGGDAPIRVRPGGASAARAPPCRAGGDHLGLRPGAGSRLARCLGAKHSQATAGRVVRASGPVPETQRRAIRARGQPRQARAVLRCPRAWGVAAATRSGVGRARGRRERTAQRQCPSRRARVLPARGPCPWLAAPPTE